MGGGPGVAVPTRTTITRELRFGRKVLVVEISETPTRVCITFRGAKLRERDIPKFQRAALPILGAYHDDPRPVALTGEAIGWTAHVYGTGDNCFVVKAPTVGGAQ